MTPEADGEHPRTARPGEADAAWRAFSRYRELGGERFVFRVMELAANVKERKAAVWHRGDR